MFTPITLIGRVTRDLELQTSQGGRNYVQFSLALNKGYGDQQHPNFYDCVIFDRAAERLVNAKVKKGSYIAVIGNLDIEEYTSSRTNAKGIRHNVTVYDWDYLAVGKKADTETTEGSESANAANGFMSTADCGSDGLPYN